MEERKINIYKCKARRKGWREEKLFSFSAHHPENRGGKGEFVK